MTKRKAVFIFNPKAGVKRKLDLPATIRDVIRDSLNYTVIPWESPSQDIATIANTAAQEGADIVVAAGGDGTVNAIASGLVGTSAALGIIPLGSGNGLARHLGIPLDPIRSVQLLDRGKVTHIDSCRINDKPFFCTAGTGFDAHIGKLFSRAKQRGFFSYFMLTLNEFRKYKAQEYVLVIDGKKIRLNSFLITFANANQYGNNAFIAPMADIKDGTIEICSIRSFGLLSAIGIAVRLFNGKIASSRFFTHYRGKQITVTRELPGPVHYDGEPFEEGEVIRIDVMPGSLKVVVQ